MKKVIALIGIVLFVAIPLFSQSNAENIHALSINPIHFGRSEFQILYELKHNNNKNSVVLAPSIILKESRDNVARGFQVMAQYRFYLTTFNKKDRHTFLNVYSYGFYAGGYSLYLDSDEEYSQGTYDPYTGQYLNKKYERSIEAIEGGAMLGVRVDITKRIILDFNIGGGIRKSKTTDTYEDSQEFIFDYGLFDRAYTGVKPKSELSLGVTF